jgi:TPR repeat protein
MKKLPALAVTGQAQAQYLIGVRYQEGDGVVQDFSKAAIWYRKAAEQNYPNALYNLGHYYYHGKGVNRDFKAAKYWFEKAASAGNDKAPGNLGVMYMIGEGVSRDRVGAFKWATIGIANGDRRAAEFRRDIAGHLTDNQISIRYSGNCEIAPGVGIGFFDRPLPTYRPSTRLAMMLRWISLEPL